MRQHMSYTQNNFLIPQDLDILQGVAGFFSGINYMIVVRHYAPLY